MNNLRKKLVVLEIFSFISSVLPLVIVVCVNLDKYVKTGADAVKLGLAGVMALLFMTLKVLGKLKLPEHRVTTYAIVFAFSYLLGRVLDDIVLISGMALLGEMIDFLFFSYAIKKTREDLLVQKTAKKLAENLKIAE